MSQPSPSRMEKIQTMLEQQPDDVFLRYALALELDKASEHQRSLAIFKSLMDGEPPYVPAFFMAGQMLARLERSGEAKPILLKGIEQANAQDDLHAAGEMEGFLEMLEDE